MNKNKINTKEYKNSIIIHPTWNHNSFLFQVIALTLLLGVFCLFCIYSITEKSLTSDEPIHLTAGASYWTLNDYRLQPENGNLPQRLAAIPLILSSEPNVNTDDDAWRKANVWEVSTAYLFEQIKHAEYIFFCGRVLVCLCVAAIAGISIFAWSKRLWGLPGAYLSITLFSLSPNFIANSRLMTSDALFASVFLVCIISLWKLLNDISLKNTIIAGCVLGATCVTKFSAVYVLPIVVTLLVVRQFKSQFHKRSQKSEARSQESAEIRSRLTSLRLKCQPFITQCIALMATALIAVFIIWGFYGFRYAGFSPEHPEGHYIEEWSVLLDDDTLISDTISFCRKNTLLPEAFLYGFSFVYKYSSNRLTYFIGDHKTHGSPWYFPFTFISKTPLSTLLILLLVFFMGSLRFVRNLKSKQVSTLTTFYTLSPILISLFVIAAFAITSNLNIGHRHILPIYPFLFVLCGGLIHVLSALPKSINFLIIGSLITYNTWATIAIFPNYIAFFNPLIGGSEQAHHFVLDSSLDWGQDLVQLKDWLDANNQAELPYYLAYFGTDSPHFRGFNPNYLHSFGHFKRSLEMPPLEPGYYCISVNMLQGLYVPLDKPFTEDHFQLWKTCYHNMRILWTQVHDPIAIQNVISNEGILQLRKDASLFQYLRFDLLRTMLLMREPEARIGYSIYVYRLNDHDLRDIFSFRTDGFPFDYPYSKFFDKYLSPEATDIESQVFQYSP